MRSTLTHAHPHWPECRVSQFPDRRVGFGWIASHPAPECGRSRCAAREEVRRATGSTCDCLDAVGDRGGRRVKSRIRAATARAGTSARFQPAAALRESTPAADKGARLRVPGDAPIPCAHIGRRPPHRGRPAPGLAAAACASHSGATSAPARVRQELRTRRPRCLCRRGHLSRQPQLPAPVPPAPAAG